MRRELRVLVTALGLAACIAGSGCERSKVSPNARITLTGTVESASGRPAGGVRVSLLKKPDAGEVIGGLTAGLATVGLVCTVDPPPAICRSARKATTRGDGSFRFTLRGSDTQGTLGYADSLLLTATGPGPGAPVTSADFKVQHERVELPALQLWDPRLRFDPRSLTPRWKPAPGDTSLLFTDSNEAAVWQAAHAKPGAPFDARVLEDADVTARVEADSDVNRQSGSYSIQRIGPAVHVSGSAGEPDSRGAPCITPRPHGVAGVRGEPCWLTDGDLGARRPVGAPRHTAAIVDLGGVGPVSLVVVRGQPSDRVIALSSDGRHFRPLATRGDAFVALSPRGAQARYVRLTGGLDVTTELSVWR